MFSLGGLLYMTNKYHPVTKEELNMIKNDCAHPEIELCNGCEYEETLINKCSPCKFKGANALMDEVLYRPDPLALLEAWIEYNVSIQSSRHPLLCNMIEQIRTNPESVRQLGIKEGWL
jgi:hypothetical protein